MLNLHTIIGRIQERLASDGWTEADADRVIVVVVDELYQLASDYVPRALWAAAGFPDAHKLRSAVLAAVRRPTRGPLGTELELDDGPYAPGPPVTPAAYDEYLQQIGCTVTPAAARSAGRRSHRRKR